MLFGLFHDPKLLRFEKEKRLASPGIFLFSYAYETLFQRSKK